MELFQFELILPLLSQFTGGNIFPLRHFPLNGANHVLKTYIFLTPARGEEKEGRVKLRDETRLLFWNLTSVSVGTKI